MAELEKKTQKKMKNKVLWCAPTVTLFSGNQKKSG